MGTDLLTQLRHAVDRHDEWPTKATALLVVDAARNLLAEQDAWRHYIETLAKDQIDPEVLAELKRIKGQ